MSIQRLALSVILVTVAALAGCKSFEERIKPVIAPGAPEGYTPPSYVKGTKKFQEIDPANMGVEVWRVDSDPYPDSIRLFVRVSDREGNLIQNLAPPYYKGEGDYRQLWSNLSERIGNSGPSYPIEDFTVREFSDQDGIPYEIALVLDYSGSMGSNIVALEDAAASFIRMKHAQDRIAIVKFDKEPRLVSEPSSSESELLARLGKSGEQGLGTYTALYSAGKLGGEQIASAPAGHPRALVIFTDGEDNASAATATDLAMYARENNIPIFAIGFGAVNHDVLTEITNYTSGRFYQTYSTGELRDVFTDIFYGLRNYYLVSYRPPYVAGKHTVRIQLSPPNTIREVSSSAEYTTVHTGDSLAGPVVQVVDTIYFEYNKALIQPESMPVLERWAKVLADRPRMMIEVQGHTDSRGTEEYNQKLSEARAEAVRKALADMGVAENRLRARGFGFSMPVASNDTDEGRARNRRTTFVILRR